MQTAAKVATISGRGKVKADDFQFAIRHDDTGTGRVKELIERNKGLKIARSMADLNEGVVRPGRGRKRKTADEKSLIGGEGESKRRKGDSHVDGKIDEDDLDEDDDDAE